VPKIARAEGQLNTPKHVMSFREREIERSGRRATGVAPVPVLGSAKKKG